MNRKRINNNQNKELVVFVSFSLALSLVSTFSYMIYTILSSNNIINQAISIISVIVLAIFSMLFVIMGLFIENKHAKLIMIIASWILTIFSISQIISGVTTSKDYIPNFSNYDVKDVLIWAEKRKIKVETEYQYSETFEKYHVIKQDVKENTNTKNINKIKVTVSDGIDPSIGTVVTNMVGWSLDDVISFIDLNHLTNVTILFEFSNSVEKDKIISQDVIREIKRNEPVILTSSLGKENEQKSVTMDNLVGLDLFHAIVYLGRNNLKYSIQYSYSEKDEEIVLKQSVKKWSVIPPKSNQEIILTVSKHNEITVPDLLNMNVDEINIWATNNRLKIEVEEKYDDSIKAGKIISTNKVKGTIINVGQTIKVIISKGSLKMIKFNDVDSFKEWADENNVTYKIDYQYSTTIDKGDLISISHKENQIIKNNDIINIVISEGSKTTVPNLLNLTKEQAQVKCKENNINCKFVYDNNNDTYTIVTKQSMRANSTIPVNTTVTVTIGK